MGSLTTDLSKDILLMIVPWEEGDGKWRAKIRAKYPGLEIRWVNTGWKIPADPLPEAELDGVTLLCAGLSPSPNEAKLLPNVRFVQLVSAGADRWFGSDLYQNPDITFCTSNGTHPPQIAEWVIGTWLMMSHRFLDYAEEQKKGKWGGPTNLGVQDSPGLRMGILGYGAIGRQCARLGQALGMEVYAHTRSEKSTPESRKDDSYCVPGTGDPDGLIPAKWFHGSTKEDVNNFLSQEIDLLVLALPLTEASKGILGSEQFEILSKKKTFVSNIARGQHIDTDALLDALQSGKIRGAALDVTDPEPLPDGHPLYTAPNVFITPHVSWQTPHYLTRVQAILERNLDALKDGKPLINVINKEHHY